MSWMTFDETVVATLPDLDQPGVYAIIAPPGMRYLRRQIASTSLREDLLEAIRER